MDHCTQESITDAGIAHLAGISELRIRGCKQLNGSTLHFLKEANKNFILYCEECSFQLVHIATSLEINYSYYNNKS